MRSRWSAASGPAPERRRTAFTAPSSRQPQDWHIPSGSGGKEMRGWPSRLVQRIPGPRRAPPAAAIDSSSRVEATQDAGDLSFVGTGNRPSADLGRRGASTRLRLKAAGHPRAASERQNQKNPMPVSGRWRGPAIDPQQTFATPFSPERSRRSDERGAQVLSDAAERRGEIDRRGPTAAPPRCTLLTASSTPASRGCPRYGWPNRNGPQPPSAKPSTPRRQPRPACSVR